MTDADYLRILATGVATKAREANIALVNAERAIDEMKQSILVLGLTDNNKYVDSVTRYGLTLGSKIAVDTEKLMMIELEMQAYSERL